MENCFRKNCVITENTALVANVGYICPECKSEFSSYIEGEIDNAGSNLYLKKTITETLKKFMNTPKGEVVDTTLVSVEQYFSNQ